MTTITREQAQAVSDLKAGYTLGHADVAILNELARIALASLEAEAVSINDDMAYAFHHALSDSPLGADEVEEIKAGLRAALANVTAPPAPVSVPDEIPKLKDGRGFKYVKDRVRYSVNYANGWNACRAAMLQGADGNSLVIPEGWVACSERMPEDEQEVIVQNKMGYRYVSYFDEHSGLFFDMRGGNQMNCIEHIFVTHWMPMPAAPQQEA